MLNCVYSHLQGVSKIARFLREFQKQKKHISKGCSTNENNKRLQTNEKQKELIDGCPRQKKRKYTLPFHIIEANVSKI